MQAFTKRDFRPTPTSEEYIVYVQEALVAWNNNFMVFVHEDCASHSERISARKRSGDDPPNTDLVYQHSTRACLPRLSEYWLKATLYVAGESALE
jgi:hypothetical protein